MDKDSQFEMDITWPFPGWGAIDANFGLVLPVCKLTFSAKFIKEAETDGESFQGEYGKYKVYGTYYSMSRLDKIGTRGDGLDVLFLVSDRLHPVGMVVGSKNKLDYPIVTILPVDLVWRTNKVDGSLGVTFEGSLLQLSPEITVSANIKRLTETAEKRLAELEQSLRFI